MIILSAGHHALQPGAVYGTYTEYPYTMGWIHKIHTHIIQAELDSVILYPAPLTKKVKEVNNQVVTTRMIGGRKYMAAELHFNVGIGTGCETLYYPYSEIGRNLADDYHSNFMEGLSLKDLGTKEGWHQMNPSKGPDIFLAKTACPAIILEPCFINELSECIKIEDILCKKIADALLFAYDNLEEDLI